jgi:hypothetical protein
MEYQKSENFPTQTEEEQIFKDVVINEDDKLNFCCRCHNYVEKTYSGYCGPCQEAEILELEKEDEANEQLRKEAEIDEFEANFQENEELIIINNATIIIKSNKKKNYTEAHRRAQQKYREKYPEKYRELQRKVYNNLKENEEWRKNYNEKSKETQKKYRDKKRDEKIANGEIVKSRGRPRKITKDNEIINNEI